MLSLLLLAAAPVAFNGGSPSELAKSIAEATKSNVVIEAGSQEYSRAFTYDPANLDEMARTILKSANLKQAPGEDYVYFRPGLPAWHFNVASIRRLISDSTRSSGSGSFPTDGLKDGRVTIHNEPQRGMPVYSLTGVAFAKPVTVDPYFADYGLSIWVTEMPERDFLNYVCKAIGARLKQTTKGFFLEPTGQEIQRRALQTFERAKKETGYPKLTAMEKAELELSRSAVASATAVQLEQLFAEEGKPVKMEIGPGARAAVLQTLRAMMEQQEAAQTFGPPQETAGAAPKPEDRFKSLDRRLVGTLVLQRGFQAHAELATFDQLGRPGTPMRVP